MTTEDWLKLAGVIVSVLGSGAVGYFIKYFLDKKASFTSANGEAKRETYQKFVNIMLSFFHETKKNQVLKRNAVDELAEFYKKYILYASPAVIKTFSDLMTHFYKRNNGEKADEPMTLRETRKLLRKMTKIFKAMRKDIGLSNKGLGYNGQRLMRAMVTDYDDLMRPIWLLKIKVFVRTFLSEFMRLKREQSEPVDSNEINVEEEIESEDIESHKKTSNIKQRTKKQNKKDRRRKK